MRILSRILLLLLLSIPLLPKTGFSQNYCLSNRFSETAFFDSSAIRIDSNIVFSNPVHAFTNVRENLKMDIYYPDILIDSLPLRPFILLIHGGAFLAGSRHDMDYQCMEYARRGFVAATIEYRLGWNCAATDIFSICLLCQQNPTDIITATYCAAQDARAAFRYIHANASQYHIDNNYLFVGGESAGGITALNSTFWDQTEANAFDPNAISRAGLLDTAGNALTDTYQVRAVINSCGSITKDSFLLNNGNIPVINFHDEFDCVVPPQYGQVISCICQPFYWTAGSEVVYSKLNANGICSKYYQVPLSTNHCSFPKPQLVEKASCFLKSYFCNTCQSGFSNQPYQAVTCAALNSVEEIQNPDNPFTLEAISSAHFLISRNNYTGNIPFYLLDISGKKIFSDILNANETEKEFSLENLSGGIYFLVSDISTHPQKIRLINP